MSPGLLTNISMTTDRGSGESEIINVYSTILQYIQDCGYQTQNTLAHWPHYDKELFIYSCSSRLHGYEKEGQRAGMKGDDLNGNAST